MNPNKESLPSLTLLRYPAAIWVLALHLHNSLSAYMHEAFLEAHPLLMIFVTRGFLGVTFFFVLSGFILAYTYDRKYSVREFYVARAARILPVYYLSLLVALPFLLYAAFWSHSLSELGKEIPVLLLLQAWYPLFAGHWNGPAWTLSGEAFFYAMFPWINGRLRRFSDHGQSPYGKCLAVIVVAAILGSCLQVFAGIQDPSTQVEFYVRGLQHYPAYAADGRMSVWKEWVEHLPLLRIFEFIIGVATYRLFKAATEKRLWQVSQARWILGFAVLSYASFLAVTAHLPFVMLLGSLAAPASAALVFAFAAFDRALHSERHEGPALRFGILLGQSSYAVYLLHGNALRYLFKIFEKLHLINQQRLASSYLLMLAISAVAVTAISILVFRFFEEPARHLVKARLSPLSPRQPRPSLAQVIEVPPSHSRVEL